MSANLQIIVDPYPGYEPVQGDAGDIFVYPRGAHVTGTVRVLTSNPLKARAILLEPRWQTSGKGDSNSGGGSPVQIHPGGELIGELDIPFAIDLPLAPLSYTGTLIKIDWSLRVRIDRPWAVDVKVDVPIVVV